MAPQERGRLGGQATVARHGKDHMSKIGAVGFAYAMKHGWGIYLLDRLAPGYRAERKQWRGRKAEPISPRTLAISIGIGLDGAVPF